jgi:hypothetical protein
MTKKEELVVDLIYTVRKDFEISLYVTMDDGR